MNTKAIDVWFNGWTPEQGKKFFEDPALEYSVRMEKIEHTGVIPEELIAMMDEAGVEISLLNCMKQGYVKRMRRGWSRDRLMLDVSYKDILCFRDKFPERTRGLYGINPWMMMDGVREMEMCVKEYSGWFVGATVHAAGFAPFNDKIWYPFYSKCAELDIPVITQAGHFGELMAEGAAHPLFIDEVALDFPELRIVAGHTGWPWTDVTIAVALKNPNVFISMEAYLPKYWDVQMVKFINTRGRDKVMWGSDWPITEQKRSLQQVEELGLRDEAKKNLMRNTAIRVFKLDVPLV